jgi:hypothetical protein
MTSEEVVYQSMTEIPEECVIKQHQICIYCEPMELSRSQVSKLNFPLSGKLTTFNQLHTTIPSLQWLWLDAPKVKPIELTCARNDVYRALKLMGCKLLYSGADGVKVTTHSIEQKLNRFEGRERFLLRVYPCKNNCVEVFPAW